MRSDGSSARAPHRQLLGGAAARALLACGIMPGPHALPDILAALEGNSREIEAYFAGLPAQAFFSGDEICWGPAHHLSHLTHAHERAARGFAAPGKLPSHERGRSRTFEEVRTAYQTRLAQVPAEQLLQNPLPPRLAPGATQADVVLGFVEASAKVRAAAGEWSETDCDSRAMPHPFLGWLSAREMLLFFVLHDRLHLEGVRRRIEAGA